MGTSCPTSTAARDPCCCSSTGSSGRRRNGPTWSIAWIVPDLFGHGQSAKPVGDYSLGAHAATLRDLLDRLEIERVTLVGHSLGGGIALVFSYLFPERVDRIILVASGGLGREVSPLLRSATLPGAEWVLPVIASGWVRDRIASAGRALSSVGVRPGSDRPMLTQG